MQGERQRVVILYSHPLLGEGLARLLAADRELDVELVRTDALESAEAALADAPDVVILERNAPIRAVDLLRFAPSALFIDVGLDAGPSWTYHREPLSSLPEELLRVIHRVHDDAGAARETPGEGAGTASRGCGRGPRAVGPGRTVAARQTESP